MAVHNHGTEQGKGLACSESLIGDCLIKEGGETIEGLRAERYRLLETIAARYVDVIDPDTGEHYYGMILVPSMPTTGKAAI